MTESEHPKIGSLVKKMKCLSCGSTYSSDEGKFMNSQIGKQLKQWHKQEERVVKLLLLGIGESGKSTITKQMKIIHIDGYTDSERREKIPNIRQNVRDAILILAGAMNNLHMPLGNEDCAKSLHFILEEGIKEDFEFTEEFYDHVTKAWLDTGVQECYHRSNEYQLFDSAKYFLDRVSHISQENYLPSDQDILRCRIMTNAIQTINFTVMDSKTEVKFSVFDVGGQQGERRKWIQVFDTATAILFVVDCSCYDLTLREDPTKNRFLEALEIFEQVWNSRFLGDVSVMLFLNKIDLLEEKVKQGWTLDKLINSMDTDDDYYSMLKKFLTFHSRIEDREKNEFIDAFPRSDPASSISSSMSEDVNPPKLKLGRKKSSLQPYYRDDIHPEVIRTAVFIKRLFMSLVQAPVKHKEPEHKHEKHSCEYYFTCAVDTRTIRKVLEGCRCFIIRKILDKWGMA